MHVNLFGQGHTRREVYAGLDRDYRRDSGGLKVLDAVYGLGVAFLAFKHLAVPDAFAACAVAYTGMAAVRTFIDQSARNFYLHRLDWEAAGPDEPLG